MLHKQGGPNLQLELNACEGQYQKIPINSECFLIGALLHYNYMPYLFKQNSTTVRELLVNQLCDHHQTVWSPSHPLSMDGKSFIFQ